MTEQELRDLLRSQGWSLQLRARRKTGKRYAYAKRRKGLRTVTYYLCPEDEITILERETVLQKLK